MAHLDAVVYAADGATVIAKVMDPVGLSALEAYDDIGAGSLTLTATDPQLAAHPTLLDDRNVVKARIDGQVVAAWTVRKREEAIVSAGGDGARHVTVSGPSIDAWFDDALVYAEFHTPYSGDTRWFNWGARRGDWYDDAAWGIPAVARARTGIAWCDSSNPWRQAPLNWPVENPLAAWVWDRDTADVGAPVGDCYFRYEFTTAGGEHRLLITADNAAQIIIDGEPLAVVNEPNAWQLAYAVDFTLGPGDHVLGIKARNLGGPAALLASLNLVGADDTLTCVTRTGMPGWRICAYPAVEPGWTFGEVLATLIDEAAARGVTSYTHLAGVTFTSTHDSAGRPWAKLPYRLAVGDTVTSFLDEQRAFGVRVTIDPDTCAVHAYNGRQAARPKAVLDKALNLRSLAASSESHLATALLVAADQTWAGATAASPHGRIEAFLNTSGYSQAEAQLLTRAVLDKAKTVTRSVTAAYTPTGADRPWSDFGVGDPVLVTTVTGQAARLVVGLAVKLGADGAPEYELELDAADRDELERLTRILKRAKTAAGTVAGRVPATPPGDPRGNSGGGGGGGLPGTDTPGTEWPGTEPPLPVGGGYFDSEGKFRQAGPTWTDTDGATHNGSPAGWYDSDNVWHAGLASGGTFDAGGKFHQTGATWTDTDGATHNGSPAGWYDSGGTWHDGVAPGSYPRPGDPDYPGDPTDPNNPNFPHPENPSPSWPGDGSPDPVHGGFDAEGKWHEGSQGHWFDSTGDWHYGSPAGWYDPSGTWHDGVAAGGTIDANGTFHQTLSGWVDTEGNTHTGSPAGWYDRDGVWHEGAYKDGAPGWYDDDGNWHPQDDYSPDDPDNPGYPGDPGNTGPGQDYLPPGGTDTDPGPYGGGIGADPGWTGNPDLAGSGIGGLAPVLVPPEGLDPWAPPTDPEGQTEGPWDVGQVSAQVAEDAIAMFVGYASALAVALCTAEPANTGGVWGAVEPVEVTGGGYTRTEVPWESFGEATGLNPVHRDLLTEVTIGPNPGPDPWPTITHVAIIVGTGVRSVIALATPITIAKDMVFTIPAGGLHITAASVAGGA